MHASGSRSSSYNTLVDPPRTFNSPSIKKDKGKRKEQNENICPAAQDNTWDWAYLTDPSTSTAPPVFTKDGSYFFSLVGPSVKIYSVATGQVVSTLTAPHCTGGKAAWDQLTCAVLNPHNVFQLIVGSLNGCLMVWDYLDAVLLDVIDISQPIQHLCMHESFQDFVFVAASRPSKKTARHEDNAVVLRISLKAPDDAVAGTVRKPLEVVAVGKTRSPKGLAFSSKGNWLVAIAGNKAYVAASSALQSGFVKYVSPEKLTCLAFHPVDDVFATGDVKGVVRLWYCLSNGPLPYKTMGVEKRLQTSTLHWHAHAVSSLSFTPNGTQLLSGGEEAVLVVWHLVSGKREFVPRVGAPINTVSIAVPANGEAEYLLHLADGTLVFVNVDTLKISRSYARIKLTPQAAPAGSSSRPFASLVVHSPSSTLLLPSSHPSFLQIYSPSSSQLVSELEVSPSNKVSRREETPVKPSRVEMTALSRSGEWLATIDSRQRDESFRGEIYLKIWSWDRKSGFWILNTRVDRPHGMSSVTHLSFGFESLPRDLQLVTTGEDGCVKVWRICSAKSSANEMDFWVARSSLTLRVGIPRFTAWSPDGSLLAIAAGPSVYIYDPITNLCKRTISTPSLPDIRYVHFIGQSGRLLVAAGARDVVLWDLVTQSIHAHHQLLGGIAHVVPHPLDESFVVISHARKAEEDLANSSLYIFDGASPVPRVRSTPFDILSVAWYPFARVHGQFSLVAITDKWNVVLLGDNVHPLDAQVDGAHPIAPDMAPRKRTLFHDIFGPSPLTDVTEETMPSIAQPPARREKDVLPDGPTYLMPPIEDLFDHMISRYFTFSTHPTEPASSTVHDVPMVVDEGLASESESAKRTPPRLPSAEELSSFVELFRSMPIKDSAEGSSDTQDGPVKVNGVSHPPVTPSLPASKTNGIVATPSVPKTNGVPTRSKLKVPPTKAAFVAAETPSAADSSLIITNGKRRRKSSG
ncbi:WD40 repeat-like protein [Fistulina hepatica ATCC 64428]|uniref:WD40 repeat-like protein n=1 Tax=Fistulina hepatica ATCC 64428 TaxID=1128425 RepID=A0A0D7AHH6_9AGAR|nr:WD40 repeat-like protein [Fistulina hepatica ATCC 64428]